MIVSNVNRYVNGALNGREKFCVYYIYLQLIIKARVHAAFFTIFFIKHAPILHTFDNSYQAGVMLTSNKLLITFTRP